jgi:hypothetical protein
MSGLGAVNKTLRDDEGFPLLTCAVPLASLPTPRHGTVEWYWLQRWVFEAAPGSCLPFESLRFSAV